MSEHVIVSRDGGVVEVRLNRPDKRNALTAGMYRAMADAIVAADADPRAGVVLFSGEGKGFTAGNDLGDFLSHADQGTTPSLAGNPFLTALAEAKVALVAAVHGQAVGIGVTMLVHCDLVIAASDTQMTTPFARLGLSPEAGSSLLMPRIMGHQRAAEVLLLGETLDAERARDFGLVNRVVAPERLMEEARAVARRLAALPPAALRASKALMRADSQALAERIGEENAEFARRLQSPEFREAATAFFEKRAPDFSKG
jgi:enoyl-CoA hydratase/carnithine racemase